MGTSLVNERAYVLSADAAPGKAGARDQEFIGEKQNHAILTLIQYRLPPRLMVRKTQKNIVVSTSAITLGLFVTALIGGYVGYRLGEMKGITSVLAPAGAEGPTVSTDGMVEGEVREPGSTFKPLTIASALWEKYGPKDGVICPIAPTTPPESENVVHWNNFPELVGTELDFQSRDGRDYAFVTSAGEGLLIFDVTERTCPTLVGVHVSPGWQNDVAVQGNLAILATDVPADPVSVHESHHHIPCPACGLFEGIELIDITDLRNPVKIKDIPIPGGAHSITTIGTTAYVSNFDGTGAVNKQNIGMDIVDISDPKNARVISRLTDAERCKVSPYPCQVIETEYVYNPNGCGLISDWRPHDITALDTPGKGHRLYVAAGLKTYILDVKDPQRIRVVSKIGNGYGPTEADCNTPNEERNPSRDRITSVHQVDPSPDGRFLALVDEEIIPGGIFAGLLCPGSGVHIYDIEDDEDPKKLGVYFANDSKPRDLCWPHVFRFLPDRNVIVIGWHGTGSWVVDISQPSVPGEELDRSTELGENTHPGIMKFKTTWGRTIGHVIMPGTVTFAAKPLMKDGKLFFYGNDNKRGFDTFEYTGTLPPPLKGVK